MCKFKENSFYRFADEDTRQAYIENYPAANKAIAELIGDNTVKIIEVNGYGAVRKIEINGKSFSSDDVYDNCNVLDSDEVRFFDEVEEPKAEAACYSVMTSNAKLGHGYFIRQSGLTLEAAKKFCQDWIGTYEEDKAVIFQGTSRFQLKTTLSIEETEF